MVKETNSILSGSSHVLIQEKVPHQDAARYSVISLLNEKVAFIAIYAKLI